MRWPLIILTALLTSLVTTRADSRPNVLFIIVDDMNDWVGCLGGHPQVKTPPNTDYMQKHKGP